MLKRVMTDARQCSLLRSACMLTLDIARTMAPGSLLPPSCSCKRMVWVFDNPCPLERVWRAWLGFIIDR